MLIGRSMRANAITEVGPTGCSTRKDLDQSIFRASTIDNSSLTTSPRRGNAPAAILYKCPTQTITCIALHYTIRRASLDCREERRDMEEQAGVLIITGHSALRALASHKMRRHGHTVLYAEARAVDYRIDA
jgi:hypothetical protein